MSGTHTSLLHDREKILGRYTVDILRPADRGIWQPAMMQLDATVTTYRLLLRPFRRRYRPASLPAPYIERATVQERGPRYCLSLYLKGDVPGTCQILNLLVSTGRLDDLHRDIETMLYPTPPRRYQIPPHVHPQHVRRLINCLAQG